MIKFKTELGGVLGGNPHKTHKFPHYYCDKCGQEFERYELKWFEDEMLCYDCFTECFDDLDDVKEEDWV